MHLRIFQVTEVMYLKPEINLFITLHFLLTREGAVWKRIMYSVGCANGKWIYKYTTEHFKNGRGSNHEYILENSVSFTDS